MRQSLAKSVRRDLRRAVGVGVVDHVQTQDQAIGMLQNAVVSLQREVAALAVNHAEFKRSALIAHDAQGKAAAVLTERLDAFEQQTATFWKRLCWVFCE